MKNAASPRRHLRHLGLSSYAYGWAVGVPGHEPARPMTALDLLRRAADLGVRVVQIADNLPLHTLPAADLDALEAYARDRDLRIEVGTRGIAAEHLAAYRALAERFGTDVVRVVIDTATHHPNADEVVALLRPQMAAFEAARVALALENHDRFPARTLARIIEQVNSPALGICLDTANSFGAEEGLRTVVDILAPWVVNLHVKDYAVRRLPHQMGFLVEGRPAGEDDLDVAWLLDAIDAHAPRPLNAILETWTPPEPDLDATIRKEAAWVEAGVAYLRSYLPT